MKKYQERRFAILNNYFKNDYRYIYNDEIEVIIDELKKIFKKHVVTLNKGDTLFRSQIGSTWYGEDGNEQLVPLDRKRMYPRESLAREGRANTKGIPYLYLASDIETSLKEVRAWPGQEVSTCTFSSKEDLSLIDLSKKFESGMSTMYINFKKGEILSKDTDDNLLGEINLSFTTPVTNSDDSSDYVLTQVISEIIKSEGYDGIVYNSFFTEKGKNIVIFDTSKMQIKNGLVFRISTLNIKFEQISNAVKYSE